LCTLQSRFSGVTFLLVTALAVYGWTVYCKIFGIKHTKARILQRHERQLTTRSAEKPDGAASRTTGYGASAANPAVIFQTSTTAF